MNRSMRIVSLLPSATEIVCALGAKDMLVGISHECDYPDGLEELPPLTRVRKTLPRESGAIDRAVREIVQEALAVYEVDVDRLREARPDVIVTQDLCDVCAVSLSDVHAALKECAQQDIEVVSLKPELLQDVWDDIRRVGDALSMHEKGKEIAEDRRRLCDRISERAADANTRPKVLSVEWLDPVMIGGTWMPELISLAGGEALVTLPGQHAPTLTREELAALSPDVVLIKPCGFPLPRTQEQVSLLKERLPWDSWTAVREGRVFVADGNAFFNRPGPRLLDSLEILAACLHPDLFEDFGDKHASSYRRVNTGLEFLSPDPKS